MTNEFESKTSNEFNSCYKKSLIMLKDMEDKIYWNFPNYNDYVCVDKLSDEERKTILERIHQQNPKEASKITLKNDILMIDDDTFRSFKGYAIVFEYKNFDAFKNIS